MVNELVIVTASYPTRDDPVYTFIRPVACGLADLGIHVTILSPQSITNAIKRKVKFRPYHWIDYTDIGNKIDIYQPKHISVSMLKIDGQLVSQRLFEVALKRAYNKLKVKPDLVYAHFWESVVAASYAIGKSNIPIVAVSGEEHVSVFETYPKKRVKVTAHKVGGMICVSTKNLHECTTLGLVHKQMKTIVLPNSIDSKVFYPISKIKARKQLNWTRKSVIGIFVGEFSNRKGVNRVIEAAKKIPELKLVLIGSGDPLIESNQILFSGILPHNHIPLYLNAADFFVLPTLAEGCCNAIVEALACGLPIISSNLPFNYDILNEDNAILVDPLSINELANAMRALINDNSLRESLSSGAIKTGLQLKIENRVDKINGFLNVILNE